MLAIFTVLMLYISETMIKFAITAMCAFSVLLRNDKVADALTSMEKEMKFIIRNYFVIHVYAFAYNTICTATPVVESVHIRH